MDFLQTFYAKHDCSKIYSETVFVSNICVDTYQY